MARNSLLRPSFLLRDKLFISSKPSFHHSSVKTLTSPTIFPPLPPQSKSFSSFNSLLFFFPSRSFCSSSTNPSNIVVIKSDEEFNNSLNKVQDDCLPAIFYFTAVWCGPCKLLSPIIEELSKKYPCVTTYKIDIDQEGLQKTLSNLKIYSVPTLHFFQNGKKATEMIGADIVLLKQTMENLYKIKTKKVKEETGALIVRWVEVQ